MFGLLFLLISVVISSLNSTLPELKYIEQKPIESSKITEIINSPKINPSNNPENILLPNNITLENISSIPNNKGDLSHFEKSEVLKKSQLDIKAICKIYKFIL